jgi:hypothetical protein
MMIEHSWKHVLAIARNQMEEVNLANGPQQPRRQDSLTTSTTSHPQHQLLVEQLGQPNTNQFYDRERLMVQALDTLFSVACEGKLEYIMHTQKHTYSQVTYNMHRFRLS